MRSKIAFRAIKLSNQRCGMSIRHLRHVLGCFIPTLENPNMIMNKLLAALAVASLVVAPAMAQSAAGDTEQNGHHYSGGPKTEVPHHMGKKETAGNAKSGTSGGHHYSGGPATSTLHHMGDKDK